MHLLRRNIGCHVFPDVSTARYIVPHLSLYFRFPQSSRQQEVTGQRKWLFLMKLHWSTGLHFLAISYCCSNGPSPHLASVPDKLDSHSPRKSADSFCGQIQAVKQKTLDHPPPGTPCLLLAPFTTGQALGLGRSLPGFQFSSKPALLQLCYNCHVFKFTGSVVEGLH